MWKKFFIHAECIFVSIFKTQYFVVEVSSFFVLFLRSLLYLSQLHLVNQNSSCLIIQLFAINLSIDRIICDFEWVSMWSRLCMFYILYLCIQSFYENKSIEKFFFVLNNSQHVWVNVNLCIERFLLFYFFALPYFACNGKYNVAQNSVQKCSRSCFRFVLILFSVYYKAKKAHRISFRGFFLRPIVVFIHCTLNFILYYMYSVSALPLTKRSSFVCWSICYNIIADYCTQNVPIHSIVWSQSTSSRSSC